MLTKDLIRKFVYENYPELSFSQLGEQQVLCNIFERILKKHRLKKTYLDIGAFDPIKGSNTFRLYQLGWHGIAVEPNSFKVENWSVTRPSDIVVTKAVIPNTWTEKTVQMVAANQQDARESIHSSKCQTSRTQGNSYSYEVETITISNLLEFAEREGLSPSMLNLDVEGLEQEILTSYDFRKKIPVLCVEQFLNEFTDSCSALEYQNSELVQYLQSKGYYLISICGISLIFAHKDFYVPFS